MIDQIQVLGKEILLPVEMKESEINEKDKLLSILYDLNPEIAEKLESQEYSLRVEGNTLIVYRTGAFMG